MHRTYNKTSNYGKINAGKINILDEFHHHDTRKKQNKNYYISRVETKQAQKMLTYAGPKVWNQIPRQIKEMKMSKFKEELKKLYLLEYC